MPRRTNLQIKVDTLREAADIMDEYDVPVSALVIRVVADAIANGTRIPKDKK